MKLDAASVSLQWDRLARRAPQVRRSGYAALQQPSRLQSVTMLDTAAAGAGGGLLKHPKASPGRLTLLSYQQMEVPAADEGLLELAGRNAALLAPLLYDADLAAGRVPTAQANGIGAHIVLFPLTEKGELRLVCRIFK